MGRMSDLHLEQHYGYEDDPSDLDSRKQKKAPEEQIPGQVSLEDAAKQIELDNTIKAEELRRQKNHELGEKVLDYLTRKFNGEDVESPFPGPPMSSSEYEQRQRSREKGDAPVNSDVQESYRSSSRKSRNSYAERMSALEDSAERRGAAMKEQLSDDDDSDSEYEHWWQK